MYYITKQYRDLPAAHRQPKHDGHCRFIHGHNWGFDIIMTCRDLDENGFVIDVGKLSKIKEYLVKMFDHTLLLNLDDSMNGPLLQGLENGQAVMADIRQVPNCGMEGLAKLVFDTITVLIQETGDIAGADRGLVVVEVTCYEDSKNSATYSPE